jgi:hypothetical protein
MSERLLKSAFSASVTRTSRLAWLGPTIRVGVELEPGQVRRCKRHRLAAPLADSRRFSDHMVIQQCRHANGL